MLLLLLIYVVLMALWKIDVHLISTLVNKSLHYYYYYYIIATDNELIRASLQLVYKALGHYHLLHTCKTQIAHENICVLHEFSGKKWIIVT